jgi:hypothetical protein
MRLVVDAASYCSDKKLFGFILFVLVSLPLMMLPLYLFVAPPPFLDRAMPAVAAFAAGSFIVLYLSWLSLKTRGLVFKVPMRVYEEGVLIQGSASLAPSLIRHHDLASLEFWYNLSYLKTKSGCSVITAEGQGRIMSPEAFRDKASLKDFVFYLRPLMERNGLRLAQEDEISDSLHVVFRRDLLMQRI